MPNNDDTLTHVSPGDGFAPSAARENAVNEATRDYLSRKSGMFQNTFARFGRGDITIINSTGDNLLIGQVFGIGAPAATPAENEFSFEQSPTLGAVTATTANLGNFGIAAAAIPMGQTGPGWGYGVCPALVNFTASTYGWADVTAASSVLTSAATAGGAQVLWSPGATGVHECLIRFVPGH